MIRVPKPYKVTKLDEKRRVDGKTEHLFRVEHAPSHLQVWSHGEWWGVNAFDAFQRWSFAA